MQKTLKPFQKGTQDVSPLPFTRDCAAVFGTIRQVSHYEYYEGMTYYDESR